jgi:hypothetical protein
MRWSAPDIRARYHAQPQGTARRPRLPATASVSNMLAYYQAVRGAATRIAGAINHATEAFRQGRIEHEPAMTDRMLGAIEESLSNFHYKGISWRAKTLTDRGAGSQEAKYGADFMGVLDIALPNFSVTKGFLAQAKLIRNGNSGDLTELKRQCEKMLNLSPDSFVFLYGDNGVRVVPAVSVVGSNLDPLFLYHRSAQRFFEEHLQCFIGDRHISAPTSITLVELHERFHARSAIVVQAKTE